MAKILIFDDNTELATTKAYLERFYGWDVVLTAAETIEKDLGTERFDLILLDLMIAPVSIDQARQEVRNVSFPGVEYWATGLEFLKRVRHGDYVQKEGVGTSPDVPVISFSAVASDTMKAEMRQTLGVSTHFDKPFDAEDLVRAIARLTEGADG